MTRRLGHRMGLASWAAPGCADGDEFDRTVRAFDTLDGSDAFVHPDTMAAVAASGKRAERAALDEVTVIVGSAVHRWRPDTAGNASLFGRIVGGDRAKDSDLARRCALESTRLSQRSIMSRTVLAPVSLNVGDAVYDVPPGWSGYPRPIPAQIGGVARADSSCPISCRAR